MLEGKRTANVKWFNRALHRDREGKQDFAWKDDQHTLEQVAACFSSTIHNNLDRERCRNIVEPAQQTVEHNIFPTTNKEIVKPGGS
jgi:hypothetical protein